MRDKYAATVTALGILTFLTFIPLAIMNQTTGWIPDIIFFTALTIFYYFTFDTWRLNVPILTIIILGHITHAMGVFGWYNISPIPIAWERVTHLLGSFSFGLLSFRFLSQWLTKNLFTRKNMLILIAILFMSIGIGAFVEMTEFWGYLSVGEGDNGALFFGAGDGVAGLQGEELINVMGGGWINEGWDMTFNLIGILAAMLLMILIRTFYAHKD
ncbi:hypothetical protein KY329_04515 [Candidatus Woesearchaeota archaeon]|nr:hypothetical protein [Candidatus Woesearchaeota archaeon]